ncbi:Calcium-dependent protein kinase 18 [Raphanus sativus]|nr:Calcium-dependent protein kinase 18 [Raphanus sativus]
MISVSSSKVIHAQEIEPLNVSDLNQFIITTALRSLSFSVLETTIDDDELDDLIDQFDVINIDKKEFISLVEMRQIDSNTDGFVNYSEFLVVTLHVSQLEEHDSDQWEQRSRAAFENFYMAKDGFITPEEPELNRKLMRIGESASMSFADS